MPTFRTMGGEAVPDPAEEPDPRDVRPVIVRDAPEPEPEPDLFTEVAEPWTPPLVKEPPTAIGKPFKKKHVAMVNDMSVGWPDVVDAIVEARHDPAD